jgi:hypothetical protein
MKRASGIVLAASFIAVLGTGVMLAGRAALASVEAGSQSSPAVALSLTPDDASLHEALALAQARGAATFDESQAALSHSARSLELRPSSPYAWVQFAEVKYRADVADATFQTALQRATYLGPHEPAVQEAVVFYGLAIWDEATPECRGAVERMLTSGLKRDPATMMQIAQRRGRLDVACRYLDPTSRMSGNWAQLCKRSGEAR